MNHTQALARHSTRLALTLAALSVAVLGACGGGGGAADTPTTPPATSVVPPVTAVAATQVSGTITGFGSVIIDGRRYDDSVTTVSQSLDPASPVAGALTDLKLGMHVEGTVRDGKLVDAVITAALNGPVASIDTVAGSFTVYSQVVKVVTTGATPTVFEGVADLAGLATGDVVEVHGTPDASKAIVATRVERKPRGEAAGKLRLGGLIANLDATAKTFRLNDMTIDYSGATVLPAGVTLANGQLFSAYGDTAPAAGVFRPKTLQVVKADDGNTMEVGGRIAAFTSAADFSVSGVRIDASAATFTGGTAADLAPGVIVGAQGQVTGGVLKATALRVLKTSTDVAASLKGQVTEFVSAASFKVRGAVVDAGGSGVSFTGGTAADLGNGAWVTVAGKVSGEVLKADSVAFDAPPVAKPVTVKGEVRDYDATAGTFKFLGITIKLGNATTYTGGTLVTLANGRRVEVTGTPGTDGVLIAASVSFLGDLAPQASVLGGRVSDLVASGGAGHFSLPGGVIVNFGTGTSVEGGTLADLANGVQVLAKGVVNGATKTMNATWIEVEQALPAGVRVAGAVTEFVSVSDFRIGGQKVDASGATFSDGTSADLANSRTVEVRGTIADVAGVRVVRASALRFLNK